MDENWTKIFRLLKDDSISEMQANGPNSFFIKRNGKREQVDINYGNAENYFRGIEASLVPKIRAIMPWDRNGYLFEGPIEVNIDGVFIKVRCHIVLPPATVYPQITIAKKSTALATVDAIAARGSMSAEMLSFLKMAVRYRLSMVISGSTGSGKTTMMEALSKYISPEARVGIAEDSAELILPVQENKTFLQSVPWQPGLDPNRVATLDWCVQQFQRMRVDLILVGETRGKEFGSFLIAANSGMDGSMTTLHADDARKALDKMTSFALIGSDKRPVRSVNNDIANSVDIIVQLNIQQDGSHKVSEITEVTNTLGKDENATISTEVLYKYDQVEGDFVKEGSLTDNLRKKLENRGANIDAFLSQPIGSRSAPMNQAPRTQQQPGTRNQSQPLNNPLQNRTMGLPVRR